MIEKNNEWFRLDNAGKLYPVLHKSEAGSIFRIAVNMKENINPQILQKAINDLKERFPTLFVKLKKGLFWYYLETNKKEVVVKPEDFYFNRYKNPTKYNDYLFGFYYYNNRITLECCHALSDGYGGLELLKAVIFRYLQLQGKEVYDENKILTVNSKPLPEETEDSYLKYFTTTKIKRYKNPNAFKITGQTIPHKKGVGVIYGKCNSGDILKVAKSYGASLTQYLSALLTYAIYKTYKDKVHDKPISICIPINLRKGFPSKTFRNFSLVFYSFINAKDEMTIQDLVELTKQQFVENMQMEKLQTFLNANVKIEKNPFIKIFPLFIKDFVMVLANKIIGDKVATKSFSNLGIVDLPESVNKHIIDFECSNTNGASALTSNGIVTLSFTREIYETQVEQIFFSELAKQGVEIEIQSNLRELDLIEENDFVNTSQNSKTTNETNSTQEQETNKSKTNLPKTQQNDNKTKEDKK